MIPGLGGMNPKKMAGLMKSMGIKQTEISGVKKVIVEKEDGNLVIDNAQVVEIEMQGRKTWQVAGDESEEEAGLSEEDVKLVMEKTGKKEEEVRKVLEEVNGNIAEAIVKLS